MSEVILNIDEQFIFSASEIICCRICHEAEFESSRSLESPCSCSGTVKFAHRDCIRRWCDEKGNTNCEICLQKFEPGYSAPPPKIFNTHVTIRERLEVPRTDENLETVVVAGEEVSLVEREFAFAECSSAADSTTSMFKTLVLVFTILLLVKHFIAVLIGETGDYPFTLLTLLLIKTCGILLPMYIIMRMIGAVHNSITRQYQDFNNGTLRSGDRHDNVC